MNQSIKQRVVGALVLLAIALIFLPVIFDGQGSYQQRLQSRIPESPSVPAVPAPVPNRPTILADSDAIKVPSSTQQSENTTSSTAATADQNTSITNADQVDEPPHLDDEGLPRSWSVRLGAFSNQENARGLIADLISEGQKAYSRKLTTSRGVMTVVYVGPGLERERMQQLRLQLQETHNVDAIVVPFEVEEL